MVAGSDPITFNGTHTITRVDNNAGTVSFMIGAAVLDSQIDLNYDGLIDALDRWPPRWYSGDRRSAGHQSEIGR